MTSQSTRRSVLTGAALTFASGAAAGAFRTRPRTGTVTATAQQASGGKPTVVLVHGALADSAGWNDVVSRVKQAGYGHSCGGSTPRPSLRQVPFRRAHGSTGTDLHIRQEAFRGQFAGGRPPQDRRPDGRHPAPYHRRGAQRHRPAGRLHDDPAPGPDSDAVTRLIKQAGLGTR